jgi:hypothetical protein
MRWWILGAVVVLAGIVAADKLYGPSLNLYAERVAPRAASASVTCVKEPGLLAGPFVAKPETARSIFEAVARGLRGDAYMMAYDIKVREEADHWTVYQMVKPEPGDCGVAPPGAPKCRVTAGGGGLQMRIDKCTGTISHAHYSR